MSRFQLTIQAYDLMDMVQWGLIIKDTQEMDWRRREPIYQRLGTTEGPATEEPPKWLRAVLEDIREQM